MKHRTYDLGAETKFVVQDCHMDYVVRDLWHARLTDIAQGYTRVPAAGGWYKDKNEEPCWVYSVANLTDYQQTELARWLLDNTSMTDVYVVHSDGIARGHCLEVSETVRLAEHKERLHGLRNTGWEK